ncbi:hypothetical protein ACVIGA_005627 [Bradyrhizobium sp. USDA 3240]
MHMVVRIAQASGHAQIPIRSMADGKMPQETGPTSALMSCRRRRQGWDCVSGAVARSLWPSQSTRSAGPKARRRYCAITGLTDPRLAAAGQIDRGGLAAAVALVEGSAQGTKVEHLYEVWPVRYVYRGGASRRVVGRAERTRRASGRSGTDQK